MSRADNIRVVVPRGWRESDAPSYPDLLLWMMRGDAKIILTAEPVTHALYCSWPVQCRTSHDISSMTGRYACALRDKLQRDHHMHVGLVEGGPKENEDAGLPSVWFEYDDGHHYMRHAIAVADNRAVGLVLEAPSSDQRSGAVRSFEQALRTLRPLNSEELATVATASGSAAAAGSASPSDIGSAGSAGSAGAPAPALALPAPSRVDPTGPCT